MPEAEAAADQTAPDAPVATEPTAASPAPTPDPAVEAAVAKMLGRARKPAEAPAEAPADEAVAEPAKTDAKPDAKAKPEDPEKPADEDKPEDEEKPKGKPKAAQWNELRRREGVVAKKERAAERAAAELEQRQRNVETVERQALELQTLAQRDPLAFMERLGIKPADIARRVVEQEGADPRDQKIAELEAKLSQLVETDAQRQKREAEERAEREQRELHATQEGNVQQVRAFVSQLKPELPYLAVYDEDLGVDAAETAVARAAYQLMVRHYEQTGGEVLAVADALRIVNSNLEEDAKRLARVVRSPAPQNGAASTRADGAAAAPTGAGPAKPEAKNATEPRTLSREDAAQRAAPERELSGDERRRNALSKLRSVQP